MGPKIIHVDVTLKGDGDQPPTVAGDATIAHPIVAGPAVYALTGEGPLAERRVTIEGTGDEGQAVGRPGTSGILSVVLQFEQSYRRLRAMGRGGERERRMVSNATVHSRPGEHCKERRKPRTLASQRNAAFR